jgi:hypothetical protein
VFILKIVKVVCFDTLLQVFILNELREDGLRVGKPRIFAFWGVKGRRNFNTEVAESTEGLRRGGRSEMRGGKHGKE